jgi:hypothetical protein
MLAVRRGYIDYYTDDIKKFCFSNWGILGKCLQQRRQDLMEHLWSVVGCILHNHKTREGIWVNYV